MPILPRFFRSKAHTRNDKKQTSNPSQKVVPLKTASTNHRTKSSHPLAQNKNLSKQAILQAQAKAREIILEAKDEALNIKGMALRDMKRKLDKLEQDQTFLLRSQQELQRQQSKLSLKKEKIKSLNKNLQISQHKLDQDKEKLLAKLEKLSGLSKKEAENILLSELKKTTQAQMAKLIKDTENEARSTAEDKAREILVDSMRTAATDYVAEYTVSTVQLPDESIKAKIIGKEGRNIRAFELKSGVDVDMDETPGEARLSSFDSFRREIARIAMQKLIRDGRIQPSRIEEELNRAKKDVEQVVFREGEKLCHAVGVYNLHKDIVFLLGKFKFRTSYGQNMISHTLEETKLGITLAQETKANIETVRLGCLLHDIGKIINDTEGSHVELGVKLLKKYNLPQPIIDAVAQHHEDEEFSSIESVLVYIADAISGARPGARRENYEGYIKRIKALEDIAREYSEVSEAYAIQAGRELRIIVNPIQADDNRITVIASEIKQKIQDTLTYPGVVKVSVIRESRVTQVAR